VFLRLTSSAIEFRQLVDVVLSEEGAMDRNSDYLTLWTHYEGCGSDDKNRMISTASLLIGFAGVLLGASISSLVASPRQLGTAAVLAILSALTALMSAILIGVFNIYAARNFNAADMIRLKLNQDLKAILDDIRPDIRPVNNMEEIRARMRRAEQGWLNWLARTPPGSATGPIFAFFSTISLFVAAVSVIVLLWPRPCS
jgi:hypothetical protein